MYPFFLGYPIWCMHRGLLWSFVSVASVVKSPLSFLILLESPLVSLVSLAKGSRGMSASHLRNRWARPLPGPLANVAGSHSSHRGASVHRWISVLLTVRPRHSRPARTHALYLVWRWPSQILQYQCCYTKVPTILAFLENGSGGALLRNLTNVRIISPGGGGRWEEKGGK